MQKRLHLRFFLICWGLLLLLLAAICSGVYAYLYHSAVTESETALYTAMEQFSNADTETVFPDVRRGMATVCLDENGMVKEIRQSRLSIAEETLTALAQSVTADASEGDGQTMLDDVSFRYQYEKKRGETRLVLTEREQEQAVLKDMRQYLWVDLLLGGALLLLVSALLSHWACRPIAQAWEKQNDFVADATHELKTPLTVIATNTEAVLANPDATIASQTRWLGSIQGETTRMAGLVTKLLFLAKADAHEIKLTIEKIPISEKIEGLCMEWETIAFEAERLLEYDLSPHFVYHGDWQRIRQMLEMMLDNAVKYTPKQGNIRVVVNRDKRSRLRIMVSNSGEPLTAEQQQKLFDRFYRVDPSRARETGGYGLGLCIAKCIAELHGGALTVESGNGINVFTAILGEPPADNVQNAQNESQ